MVSARDALRIYERLLENGIQLWLSGGWGIDALLGEQTRAHKDLDVIMLLDDVVRARELLNCDGYSLKELWAENRWAVDAAGVETATAFVLQDAEGREFDAHAMRLDELGNGIPAWAEADGFIFRPQDLTGEGFVAGVAVKCLSPEAQVMCHTGYELPDKHGRDMKLLKRAFGVK
jgi:lincosamide nucleotidyltransferase A/C/D/E